MTAELNFVLKREQIDDDVIQKLELAGVMSISHFACLVPDQEAMRKLAKLALGYGDDDLACVAKVARLLCAWEVTKTRTSEVNKMDAENEVRGQPKTISSNDFDAMKEAFEKQFLAADRTRKRQVKATWKMDWTHWRSGNFVPENFAMSSNYSEDDAVELRPVWDH